MMSFKTFFSGACLFFAVSLSCGTALAQSTFQPGSPARGGTLAAGPVTHIPGMAVRWNAVKVPECKFMGQTVTADLSTTSVNGVDPHWQVSGPAQTGLGGPTHATHSGWTAVSGYWIQPFSAPSSNQYGTANQYARGGTYTYTLHFNLPCMPSSYGALVLGGTLAADNSFTAYLNGISASNAIASCGGTTCFQNSGTSVNFSTGSKFRQGDNTLYVVVKNADMYTGMAAKLTLRIRCGKMCCRELPRR